MKRNDESEGVVLSLKVIELTKLRGTKNIIDDSLISDVKKRICALLNTEGGTLKIECCELLNISEKTITDFIRKVEQHVYEISDCNTFRKMKIKVSNPQYVLFHVKPSSTLCTINYNLCVPSETQVISLPSKEYYQNILEIMKRKRLPKKYIKNGSHYKNFVHKMKVSSYFRESKTVQVKIFKAQPSKSVSLSDRITNRSNKLINLVSAFANDGGGHLYIGINSVTYEVEGVQVQTAEQYRIRNKVAKVLSKMIWPDPSKVPTGVNNGLMDNDETQDDEGLHANEEVQQNEMLQENERKYIGERNIKGKLVNKTTLDPVSTGYTALLGSEVPKKGHHWDIYFEPVLNSEGYEIPETFVIVIYVAPVPGGVFFEEPESYHINNGEVQQLDFESWKMKLMQGKNENEFPSDLVVPPRRQGSIPELITKKYLRLSEYLQQLRKEGDWRTFDHFTSKTLELSNPKVKYVVTYEKALAARMKKEHAKASKHFNEFCKLLKSNAENPKFEVQKMYLEAILYRSKGEYGESYRLTRAGLEKAMMLKDSVTAGWFYQLLSSVAAILATEKKDSGEYTKEAREYNMKGLLILENFYAESPTALADLRQAIYLNMAWLSLNSSVKSFNECQVPDISKIQEAQGYLFRAQSPCVGSRGISQYNACKTLLAESDLQYRLSQIYPIYKLSHIKSAFKIATQARDIAKRNTFLELLDYSLIRMSSLTVELVREGLKRKKIPSEQENLIKELSLDEVTNVL